MSKEEFLKELYEIIEDPIFIGNNFDDIHEEIHVNTWSISMGQELANEFTAQELTTFFEKVINNRKKQIANNGKHGMIFYSWNDFQSGRIRFNLISDFHKSLPFGRDYKELDDISVIINEFLNYPYHDGIEIVEIPAGEVVDDEEIELPPLNVYVTNIKKG